MNWQTLFDPSVSSRLCLTLLHSLWQLALLAMIVWVIARLWRKQSVECSYALHVGALVLGLAALPITYAVVQSPAPTVISAADRAIEFDSSGKTVVLSSPLVVTSPGDHLEQQQLSQDLPTVTISSAVLKTTTAGESSALWLRIAPWLVGMYASGVVLMLIRLAIGILHAERLASRAKLVTEGPLVESLRYLSKQWSMRVVPVLAQADQLVVPKVVGLLKPTILIPTSAFSGLTVSELEMILAHELAHVRRYDMWINLLQRLAEAALFFSPGLWYLSRRISTLREYCCDELTCRAMSESESDAERRTLYAAALLHLVELHWQATADRSGVPVSEGSDVAALAASGRSPSELRRRVARLFGEPLREPVRLSRVGLLTLGILVALLPVGPTVWQSAADSAPRVDDEQALQNEGRVIRFPADRSIGLLHIRDDGPVNLDKYDWEVYTNAIGEIAIPAGKAVMLDMSRANSTGPVDLSPLSTLGPNDLQSLMFSGRNVQDSDLAHLRGLTGLKELDLSGTPISDAGLENLADLTQIESLDLAASKVTDAGIKHLARLHSLRKLVLNYNAKFGDNGLAELKKLKTRKSLEVLVLSGTNITDAGLVHLKEFPLMRRLSLDRTDVGDEGLVHLRGLKSLEVVRMYGTRVGDAGMAHLAGLTSLKNLSLPSAVTDAGVKHLQGLTSLEYLSLSSTQVTEKALVHLKTLTSLKRLSLPMGVTDAGLVHLRDLPRLEEVRIENSPVTEKGLVHLKDLPSLKSLVLHRVHVSDAGYAILKEFPALERLLMIGGRRGADKSGIGDEGLAHVGAITALKYLNLSSSRVTDAGLSQLKNLSALEHLDLSRTRIGENGLAHLRGLSSLKYLSLLDCPMTITAAGVDHLKQFASLTSLDLSRVNITHNDLRSLRAAVPQVLSASTSEKDDWKSNPVTFKVGDVAPVFNVQTFDGKKFRLSDQRGKAVLVYFWAPCVAPTPELKELYQELKEKHQDRFEMVSLSMDRVAWRPRRDAEQHKLTWPQACLGSSAHQICADYGVVRVAEYFVVGPDGKIACAKRQGRGIKALKAVKAEIDSALGGELSTTPQKAINAFGLFQMTTPKGGAEAGPDARQMELAKLQTANILTQRTRR